MLWHNISLLSHLLSASEKNCRLTQALQYQVGPMIKKFAAGCGAHALVCTAGSEAAYKQAPDLLRNLCNLVFVGLVESNLPISPFEMVVRSQYTSLVP